jgi:DNA repair exonuclease SbcCD ATPase subunit
VILLRHLRVTALKQLREIEIWFPRQGAVLVEGHNEAGKSTLFEAIYFALYGSPLVGEETRPTYDDLIPHGHETAQVALTVVVGETELDIRRVLRRRPGKRATQEAEVRVRAPGAPLEALHGPRAVNDRILQELHGLDGEALRNSCFMEQKALDRIESLSRRDREGAVARLLGLERLREIEDDIRQALAQQEQQAQRHREEIQVAEARRVAREAATRAAVAAERLRAARVRELLAERDQHTGERQAQARQEDDLAQRRAELEQRLAEAERLQALLGEITGAEPAVAAAVETAGAVSATEAGLRTLARLAEDELAPVEARLQAITAAQAAQHYRDATAAALALAERALAARQAVTAAQQAFANAEREQQALQAAAERQAQRLALERWIRAQEVAALARGDEQTHVLAERQLEHATERADTARRAVMRTGITAAVALAAAAVSGVAGLAWRPAWAIAALALLALAITLPLLLRAGAARRQTLADLRTLQGRQQEQRARQAAARELAGALADLPALDEALRQARLPVPASLSAAREQLAAMPAGADTPDAAQALAECAATVALRRAALEAAQSALAEAQVADRPDGEPLETRGARLRAELSQQEATLQELLAALSVRDDPAALAALHGAASVQLQQLRLSLAKRDTLMQQIEDERAAMTAAADKARRIVAVLWQRAAGQGLVAGDPPLTGDPQAITTAYTELRTRVEAALAALDATDARITLATLDERRRGLSHLERGSATAHDDVLAELRALLAEQGLAEDADASAGALAVRWPLLAAEEPQSVDELAEEATRERDEAHYRQRHAVELALVRQLEDIELDEAACREALRTSERLARQHRLALELAQAVRARIVQRVLPETAAYMRALLPELTAGRYRDVRLQSDDSEGADLRIHVWDQAAGRYVAKNIFSGGTRDQCSLALRLAFALATLPKELGAVPGFMFLDEPLSSFDSERARALVDVLTSGTIARQFAQIVVISHSHSFEHTSFPFHLRLAAGRVIESDLPSGQEAADRWFVRAASSGERQGE